MRSSLVRMRSSLVVRASDCQCTSCNGPGFDPSIRRHRGIWGAADEAVLNIVRKENNLVERCNLEWMRLRCSLVVSSSNYQSELCNSPEILSPEPDLRLPPTLRSFAHLWITTEMVECYWSEESSSNSLAITKDWGQRKEPWSERPVQYLINRRHGPNLISTSGQTELATICVQYCP